MQSPARHPDPIHHGKVIQLALVLHARPNLDATVRDAVVAALARLLLEAASARGSVGHDDAP
jgi:hypothetical protein